jgi:hypothetical protein
VGSGTFAAPPVLRRHQPDPTDFPMTEIPNYVQRDNNWDWYQSHVEAQRNAHAKQIHDLRVLLKDLFEKTDELEHVHMTEDSIEPYQPERDHLVCPTCAIIFRVEKEIQELEG